MHKTILLIRVHNYVYTKKINYVKWTPINSVSPTNYHSIGVVTERVLVVNIREQLFFGSIPTVFTIPQYLGATMLQQIVCCKAGFVGPIRLDLTFDTRGKKDLSHLVNSHLFCFSYTV